MEEESSGNKAQKLRTEEEHFVWPWKGILANVRTQHKDGRVVGDSGSKLQAQLSSLNPLKVTPIWNYHGHSGFAIVDFCSDMTGFMNAMYFESDFEVKGQGKKDWEGRSNKGAELYGWMARQDDYEGDDKVGEHLRKRGDLKTVAELERREKAKQHCLIGGLLVDVEGKNKTLMELGDKCAQNELAVDRILQHRDQMLSAYNEEIEKMNRLSSNHLRKVMQDNMKLHEMLALKEEEAQQTRHKYLKLSAMERERSMETSRLAKEMKSIELASMEKEKADVKMWKLLEEHKEEKEKLKKRILQLDGQFNARHKLELEIRHLKGQLEKFEVMKNISAEDEPDWIEKFKSIQEDMKDKIEEMEEMESFNQALVIRERRSNEELEAARDVLLKALEGRPNMAKIGVKRMGEIDQKVFKQACRKLGKSNVDKEAAELALKWQNEIQNPAWSPFKLGPNGKNVINEEDEKLQYLKELDDEAYNGVITAVLEIIEYNPGQRLPVAELWHFKENRKASLEEAVLCTLNTWKYQKKSSSRN